MEYNSDMTNEELLEDFKQYTEARLSQMEVSIKTELKTELNSVKSELIKRMDDGFAAVAEVSGNILEQVDDHETRISTLESAA